MVSSTMDTDVAIFGAGPAGACTALSLLNYTDLDITLIEQSDLNRERIGEHVTESIFDFIDYLKIDAEAFGNDCFIPSFGSTSYWGSDLPGIRNSVFTTQQSTFQLNRELFDFQLLENIADRNGKVIPRTHCKKISKLEDNRWELKLSHPTQGEFTLRSRFIVDASGRNANISRQLGLGSKKVDDLMAVGRFFQCTNEQQRKQEYLIESTEHGWWYGALLPGNQYSVCFFSDADIIADLKLNQQSHFNALLAKTKHIRKLVVGTKVISPNPWVRKAYSQNNAFESLPNFLAIGDAACAFDPISSLGIGFALSSGCHAAKLIDANLSEPKNDQAQLINQFQTDLHNQFDHYLTLRQQIYQQENRWNEAPFWLRRQSNH
ncbi:lysine-epsilon-oxidase maturase LodB [Colwellia sp. E2M01]|uniref:lysine-epsilon-oxidase maturase LodB n=1 Tax=Colwellia sp. E2M01 TaxID=2841561 RepID=UPI001C08E777|nr:lysine-epsilon-oxidase maturase LodB [Colwellia sp. E2M01]MBU2872339.1 lysine-epsilon-oxidase maturase LodB [Colwellia sp. E2M01]